MLRFMHALQAFTLKKLPAAMASWMDTMDGRSSYVTCTALAAARACRSVSAVIIPITCNWLRQLWAQSQEDNHAS